MIPTYNPVTDTIGTTQAHTDIPQIKKIHLNPQFKNFIKFNTPWGFEKTHAKKCDGFFEHDPHFKNGARRAVSKRVCTVCGASKFEIKYNAGEETNGGYTLPDGLTFEGYIPKKLLGMSNDDNEIGLNEKFDNHCVACETGFNGPTNDICPSCRNKPFDDVTWNYEEHATSHAGLIEVWQQGQAEEVADSNIDYSRRISISRERYNSISARMMATTDENEKQKLLKQCISINKYNDKIHAAELSKAQNAKKARAEMLSFDISHYTRNCEKQQDNATTTTEEGKPYFVMVTGHRPQQIPRAAVATVKLQLLEKVQQLKQAHPNIQLISGMALGVDTWYCEIAKKLSIPLNAYVPFKNQCAKWKQADKMRYFHILNDAVKINITAKTYSNAAYLKRNKEMVQAANECIAIWNGKPSGTGNAVKAAQNKNIPLTVINPMTV